MKLSLCSLLQPPATSSLLARGYEMRNAHRILVGISEGKRPIRRSRPRWEDNIRMDRREIGWREDVNRIYLVQDTD
jgi:hypothetical protein